MNIKPGCCPRYIVGINFISVFLVFGPRFTKKLSARDWNGVKQGMEFTVVDDWYCADKRSSNCFGVSSVPISALEADMR